MSGCCKDEKGTLFQEKEILPLTVTMDYLELPHSATFRGGNISPSINLTGLDKSVKSIAIMVFNPFIKSCCSFTPWIICNIPPIERIPHAIPATKVVNYPFSAVQGINDYGEYGYHGPEPGPGEIHRYQFRVYALDVMLTLSGGFTKDELTKAMVSHVIQYGESVVISTG